MNQQVFISYKSDDLPWAEKLERALDDRGITVWRDATGILAGDEWEKRLQPEVRASKHMVVLWSKVASESQWVQKELATFDAAKADPTPENKNRRMILVNLEEQGSAYNAYQRIDDLREAGVYGKPPADVDVNVWNRVVQKIVDAVQPDDGSIPINLAVLTLTTRAWQEETAPLAVQQVRDRLGLTEPNELERRYGERRLDWKPYGREETIQTILDELLGSINDAVPSLRFRWQPVSEDLWSEDKKTDAAVAFSGDQLGLVVIDAVALRFVLQQLMTLSMKASPDYCAWLVIAPRASEQVQIDHRDLIRQWSTPVLDPYFTPPVPRTPFLQNVGVYCGDSAEIKRLLRSTIGQYDAKIRPRDRSGYLSPARAGTTHP